MQADISFIVVHLNPLSARLQFLVNKKGEPSASFPQALDPLATLDVSYDTLPPVPHTASHLKALAKQLGLAEADLELVTPLLTWVETPKKLTAIALVKLTTQAPPSVAVPHDYISLMELLQVPIVERLLFKKAYEVLLGD